MNILYVFVFLTQVFGILLVLRLFFLIEEES